MMEGKVKSALKYITNHCDNRQGGVLPLDHILKINQNGQEEALSVCDILRSKHPSAKASVDGSLLFGPVDFVDPVIYDAIDGEAIRRAALKVNDH